MNPRHARVALLAAALAGLALAAPVGARAAPPERLKLEGRWDGEVLAVERARTRDPRRDRERGLVAGEISGAEPDAHRFRIGPLTVEWDQATRFEGIDPDALLAGSSVEVRGRLVGERRLRATRIEPGPDDPGWVELLGLVTERRALPHGGVLLTLLGVRARVPAALRIESAGLTRDPDDKRPDEQLTVQLLGRPLTLGGEIGSRLRFDGDLALDADEADDRLRLDEELQLELFFRPAERVSVFLEGKAAHERELAAEGGGRGEDSALERGESWLFVSLPRPRGVALQIGRQAFREDREWWWDEDLDALRLYWTRFPFAVQLGVARELAPVSTAGSGIDPEDEDVLRLLARGTWRWLPKHTLDAFVLRQSDRSARPQVGQRVRSGREDPSDPDLLWYGLRATGEIDLGRLGELDYWTDLARVSGDETVFEFEERPFGTAVAGRRKRRVSGWAVDAGLTWATELPGRPALTLGYAMGSGHDGLAEGSGRAFRQTGLHDNNARFRGVDRFRYYGELFDPELSNLQVATVALGFRFWRSSSIELVYHFYRQDEPAPFLRDTRIDARPLGVRRTLGQEWDVVVGLEEWEHVEIELVASLFRAGRAFGPLSGELAIGGFLKVDLNF